MHVSRKTGFTLVELLVVISIIGVLAAALISQVTRAGEMARTSRCKANLKNLAQAAMSYAVETEFMPWAGSHEASWPALVDGKYRGLYHERPGWVAWTGPCKWNNTTITLQGGSMKTAKFYGDDAYNSITNGALWTYIGKDLGTFVCEKHRAAARRAGLSKVLRSYVMNGYFVYANQGKGQLPNLSYVENSVSLSRPERVRLDTTTSRGSAGNLLLFAELPAYKGNHTTGIDSSEYAADGVLEADIRGPDDPDSTAFLPKTASETIGFNHLTGKRYVAHVVFVDGHVDALIEPKGASDNDLKKLTYQLCNGDEIDQDFACQAAVMKSNGATDF